MSSSATLGTHPAGSRSVRKPSPIDGALLYRAPRRRDAVSSAAVKEYAGNHHRRDRRLLPKGFKRSRSGAAPSIGSGRGSAADGAAGRASRGIQRQMSVLLAWAHETEKREKQLLLAVNTGAEALAADVGTAVVSELGTMGPSEPAPGSSGLPGLQGLLAGWSQSNLARSQQLATWATENLARSQQLATWATENIPNIRDGYYILSEQRSDQRQRRATSPPHRPLTATALASPSHTAAAAEHQHRLEGNSMPSSASSTSSASPSPLQPSSPVAAGWQSSPSVEHLHFEFKHRQLQLQPGRAAPSSGSPPPQMQAVSSPVLTPAGSEGYHSTGSTEAATEALLALMTQQHQDEEADAERQHPHPHHQYLGQPRRWPMQQQHPAADAVDTAISAMAALTATPPPSVPVPACGSDAGTAFVPVVTPGATALGDAAAGYAAAAAATGWDPVEQQLMQMFPDEALKLGRSEFAAWKAANLGRPLAPHETKALAKLRRKVLSRVYANRARQRRAAEREMLEIENAQLRQSQMMQQVITGA